MRLTANGNSHAQMFYAIFEVALTQQFFTQLNFLEEKFLDGLLVIEIWQREFSRIGFLAGAKLSLGS